MTLINVMEAYFNIFLGVLSHYSSLLCRNVCSHTAFRKKMDINIDKKAEMGVFLSTSDAVRVDIYTEGAYLYYVFSSF